MIDLHTHLWPHAPGPELPTYDELARRCERAAKAGVEQFAVTEHCHRFVELARVARSAWRRADEPALRVAADRVWDAEGGARLDAYVDLLTRARDRGLPLLVGLELDHLPGAEDAIAGVLRDYPFDVVLGSVHWIGSWLFDAYDDPTFAAEWERRAVDDVWRAYADAVVDLARSGTIDVLAHVDVIKVAGRRPRAVDAFESTLVDVVTATGVAVEVSSAGLRKPACELYPSPSLLARLAAAGVAFTTASDAHHVERIGDGFDVIRAALQHAGVPEVVSFSGRRRVAVSL